MTSKENKAFHTKEWWMANGLKQQIAKMLDNYRNTDGDDKIAWRTIKRSFCNENQIEEDIGCGILVANSIQKCEW
jgi:hypothetical protein